MSTNRQQKLDQYRNRALVWGSMLPGWTIITIVVVLSEPELHDSVLVPREFFPLGAMALIPCLFTFMLIVSILNFLEELHKPDEPETPRVSDRRSPTTR